MEGQTGHPRKENHLFIETKLKKVIRTFTTKETFSHHYFEDNKCTSLGKLTKNIRWIL